MSRSTVLYEDDDIVVILRPAPEAKAQKAPAPAAVTAAVDPLTLITFADLTFRPDGDTVWGQEPGEKLGLAVIGFVAKRENWFPAAAIRLAAPAVRAALPGPALCYGYSMGGYAALKYARLLGASRALAISPQASIDPADIPTDQRFHQYFDPALHANQRIGRDEAPEFGVMLADPYHREDALNASMLVEDAGIQWLRTPFMSHAAIWLLTDTSFLRQVIDLVIAADTAALAARLRARRHNNVHWHFWVAHAAFLRHKPDLAARLWDRAEELGLDRNVREREVSRLLGETMRRLIDGGRRGDARALALSQAAKCGSDPVALAQIGHILVGMGEGDAAEAPFRASLALRRDISNVYQGLSLVLVGKGRLDDAIAVAKDGIHQAPGDAGLHVHLGYLLLNAAKLDDAQGQFDTVLGQMPGHVGAIVGKSHVLGAFGRQGDAIELVKQALPLDPADAGMRVWLGQLLLVVGQPAEAEPHFRDALALAPEVGAAHIGLARSLERTGRLDEARHVAADAAAALPNDARVQAIARRMGPPVAPRPLPAAPRADAGQARSTSGLRRMLSLLFGR
jgi:tetratricopeptide (TPR) repeat protein